VDWIWRGEYFPRVDLAGTPTLIRNDTTIDFNWGRYAPVTGMPADGFSARWVRTLWFDQGTYRFHATVDDGVRLYVDNILVINAWQDGGVREVTGDRTLNAGTHTVRVEYYERTGEALIRTWWEKTTSYPDWRGEYWSNRWLDGTPTVVRNDASIDFNWVWGSPAVNLPTDDFSARWVRTVNFDAATYRFHVLVDDGARLWIDDRLVIDSWRDGAVRELREDRTLTRGDHRIKVEFYERTGEARIRVWWEKVTASYPDWKGQYWSNRKLDGKPALVRNDKAIDFQWGKGAAATGLPADNFSARWTRKVTFDRGLYSLYAWADDGVRVYVDDKLVLNEWHDSDGDEVYVVDLQLSGQKDVTVEYYDRTGSALVKVWWKRTGAWPTPTATPKPTTIPTATPTSTPQPTATPTSTPEPTATPTSTPEPTATPTSTPEPTAMPTSTPEPTATPTSTPEPTATPTATTEPAEPTATPTLTPTPEPVTNTVRLNEVMPVPAQDGIVDELEEWIELYNAGSSVIDLSGWFLDDGAGGSDPYQIHEGATLAPGAFILFHGRITNIALDDTGDEVRLLNPDGEVTSAVTFGRLAPNASYSRDEIGNWHADWSPSPGAPNHPPTAVSSRANQPIRVRGWHLAD
jgi:hypothetical protein